MKQIVLVTASVYGGLAVILGAFGAHLLKGLLSSEKLASFEVGVKYQLIHAVVLLVIGFQFDFQKQIDTNISYLFIIGILLFSFSIYALSLSSIWGIQLKWLGPVTPLGGLSLIFAWALMVYRFIKYGIG